MFYLLRQKTLCGNMAAQVLLYYNIFSFMNLVVNILVIDNFILP